MQEPIYAPPHRDLSLWRPRAGGSSQLELPRRTGPHRRHRYSVRMRRELVAAGLVGAAAAFAPAPVLQSTCTAPRAATIGSGLPLAAVEGAAAATGARRAAWPALMAAASALPAEDLPMERPPPKDYGLHLKIKGKILNWFGAIYVIQALALGVIWSAAMAVLHVVCSLTGLDPHRKWYDWTGKQWVRPLAPSHRTPAILLRLSSASAPSPCVLQSSHATPACCVCMSCPTRLTVAAEHVPGWLLACGGVRAGAPAQGGGGRPTLRQPRLVV